MKIILGLLLIPLLIVAGSLIGAVCGGVMLKIGWWLLSMEAATGFTLTWRYAIFAGWALGIGSARVST